VKRTTNPWELHVRSTATPSAACRSWTQSLRGNGSVPERLASYQLLPYMDRIPKIEWFCSRKCEKRWDSAVAKREARAEKLSRRRRRCENEGVSDRMRLKAGEAGRKEGRGVKWEKKRAGGADGGSVSGSLPREIPFNYYRIWTCITLDSTPVWQLPHRRPKARMRHHFRVDSSTVGAIPANPRPVETALKRPRRQPQAWRATQLKANSRSHRELPLEW